MESALIVLNAMIIATASIVILSAATNISTSHAEPQIILQATLSAFIQPISDIWQLFQAKSMLTCNDFGFPGFGLRFYRGTGDMSNEICNGFCCLIRTGSRIITCKTFDFNSSLCFFTGGISISWNGDFGDFSRRGILQVYIWRVVNSSRWLLPWSGR
jgi:hypothetical protein